MNLSAKLADDFSDKVREKGRQLWLQGAVRIKTGSSRSVTAIVSEYGYFAALDLLEEEDTLIAWCDCDYFQSADFCEHIWATILAADAASHLSEAASIRDLLLDYADVPEFDDLDDLEALPTRQSGPRAGPRPALPWHFAAMPAPPPPRIPTWQEQFAAAFNPRMVQAGNKWPEKRRVFYNVDVNASQHRSCVTLMLETRDQRPDGQWSVPRTLTLKREQIQNLPPEDREIMAILAGVGSYPDWGYRYSDHSYDQIGPTVGVRPVLAAVAMPLIARTGRCCLRTVISNDGPGPSLAWDDGGPWRFSLRVHHDHEKQSGWKVTGMLERGDERMENSEAALITPGGLVFTQEKVAPLAEDTRFDWVDRFRLQGPITVPETDRDELLTALLCSSGLPPVQLPGEVQYETLQLHPRPDLRVLAARNSAPGQARLPAQLRFNYEDRMVSEADRSKGWYEAANRRFLARDAAAETAAAELLKDLGAKPEVHSVEVRWGISAGKLPRIVRGLVEAGWHIEAEGKIFRKPGAFRMEVSSGVDWFELHGEIDYGGGTAKLPELLAALRRGEDMVRLDNGDYGLLPEEWLRRFGPVAGLGTPENGHLRFRPSQAGLLDALLATQPEARCDETFARVRQELASFQGVAAAEQPAGFVGQLRDYQREGLGWMHFLRRFSFGGCLADDMGVGKTAQVLALLETRRESQGTAEAAGPSLVVVPKSLVFNWKLEAARFAPQLRVLDYTGVARNGNDFADYDIVLTTYGTLRRDALLLKDVEFDYVVLDEAQAVKNASTESSKAVRLLRGRNRLALSGTPMENHLGELWTLFEFLNPGMLGAASAFKLAGGPSRNPDEETRKLLAAALRPFILRRTKEQVARELPAKAEQVLYCEMEPPQRKLYNELLQHYRANLLKQIDTQGMAKSKIQVLEALLRLRQAACHPGLIDKKRCADPSAKLEMLIEQLTEVLEEGHKALVFSQFTSLLSIVRDRLDARNIIYEYLDGKTHDRQARVERFQNDADCRLFLVSLKAGGLGLNLTAAEYVFLLDPWWNPAVEAQAVDRAHRIGQTRRVFAYRLITRDTVEEKVLKLQETKRDLAAAIIGADNSLIRNLQREDLELLLS